MLTIGVIGTSLKEHEQRVPIHPEQISWIPEKNRKNLFFEIGYGECFGVDDEKIASLSAGLKSREEIFKECDVVLLPKPVQQDFDLMREEGILWGWPHCVQQKGITETAIQKKLSLIAWEAMFQWGRYGEKQMHIFYKNNELAGYAGVLHALSLIGSEGNYGPSKKVVVISFGSVSRGAVYALQGVGFKDISVFTQRPSHLVAEQIPGIRYRQMKRGEAPNLAAVSEDGGTYPFIEELKGADIIVNGILQDTDNPLMFVRKNEVDLLKPGALIVDVSCDECMGFPFARPTTFEAPLINVGNYFYYAVDHTPTYFWNSASWEISKALIPFIPVVMDGPEAWEKNEVIRRAIEILSGVIQNPKILSFQNRSAEYPHPVIK